MKRTIQEAKMKMTGNVHYDAMMEEWEARQSRRRRDAVRAMLPMVVLFVLTLLALGHSLSWEGMLP